MLPGRESKTHSARETGSLGRQPFPTFASACGNYHTATFGGHAFAKTEFAGSAKFGWSKCRLHGEIKKESYARSASNLVKGAWRTEPEQELIS